MVLARSFGTVDKFTHKFPRLRGFSKSGNLPPDLAEEGAGLGVERVGRWTASKWFLLFSVLTVFGYGGVGLVCALMTWFRTYQYADVTYVADYDLLVLLTLASSILLLTALIGLAGTLLNSRPLLAVYALLLWPAFGAILALGYPTYKRYAFALDRKLSLAWSQYYTTRGRRTVQDALGCCGFLSAAHDAAASPRCYARAALPGCKGALWRVERAALAALWGGAFGVVPLHILNVAVALLCANHVTRTFGKGVTPKRYRLTAADVRADAETLVRALAGVARPDFARAGTSSTFREDRKPRLFGVP
ncbi:uncharacterized protein BXZ73DRAFT_46708 [Epithele typhae]|uniref:uncharacterized protein n=1 Tax=Epithele typhae TaxID=378194 RepID=UPI002008C0F1|nr:uncharacterized protein BXZ73DRAFT_46708 [Epithele typhae]KAH9932775.1 hypothetical protein BXZ73DRAFT_46708 [Epithele typhae]